MAIDKVKENGGSGGKLGHSNMAHRTLTARIKTAAKKVRRLNAKRQIREALRDA